MQLQSSKKQIIFSSLLCFSAIAFPVASQAITVQEVPNPRQVNHTWVTDRANILSDSTETQLNQMIAELEAKNGSEIAVVTVPDTKPSATPKAFSTELFNFWGIGKKGKNNGVLLLISSGERRVQIETGSGIQSLLPDAKMVSIIQTEITPRFKQQDFDGGTLAGTKALVNVLQTPIANVQSQNALPLAPIVPSQALTPSPIPAESPVISNSKSTGEDSWNLIYGLLGLLFIAFIAFFIPCFILFRIFRSLFSRISRYRHRRYPRNYTSNNRNYSSNSQNYYGGGGYYSSNNIDYSSSSDYSINSSSDDCRGYYSTNSSDYSMSNSDCGGSFGGGDSSGGGAGGDYSISNSDCGGSFGGGDSSGGGAGGDYSISNSDCGSSSSSDYSSSSSSDYSSSSSDYSSSSSDYSSSSSDSSSGGGGGDW
ncbi:TPM domain-containing protein [Lyngbya sp. CCAP 1446/10]|uniref:TPM domain-containing protein n=1 Tax=Lyngbya sp. CCAP 1446/10 TaxID=439293 RepID=UPI002236F4C4|nr:TPM domain-containing protein [Lyngbya sp. CCAP 1446/10]MCW6053515.1 TPM domain-containing protein [Lyngbya sp. CCAP 1446/10]